MSRDNYDADTTGDFDENTLDGSEGLDATVITGDGENYVMDVPDKWRGADPHDTLDSRLAEEKPDVDPFAEDFEDPEGRFDNYALDEDITYGREADQAHDPDRPRKLGFTPY